MNILKIKRTDPVNGVVVSIYPFMDEQEVTPVIPYNKALKFVKENQEDLTVYKVAMTLRRKNGKRKLYKKILAHDHAEAFMLYSQLMKTADQSYDYQLLTGNWQPLKY